MSRAARSLVMMVVGVLLLGSGSVFGASQDFCRWIPAAAETLQRPNGRWSTDLEIANAGDQAATVRVELLTRDVDNSAPQARELDEPLPAGASVTIPAVAGWVLAHQWQSWYGGLRVCSDSPAVVVSSRTSWRREQAGFGTVVAALDLAQAVGPGTTGELVGLREDARVRSNLGLLNASPWTISVRLTVLDDSGSARYRMIKSMRPLSQVQIDHVLRQLGGLAHGRIRVASPDGPVFAFASLVDNATNDPSLVLATVRPSP